MSGGMRPTHTLTVKAANSGSRGVVGAAWEQADGSFYVKLNACVVLDWRDDVTIRIFPVDSDAAETPPRKVVPFDPRRRRTNAERPADGEGMGVESCIAQFLEPKK